MSEPRIWVKTSLFMSSYIPLWGLFLLNMLGATKFHPFARLLTTVEFCTFICLLVFPFFILLIFLRLAENGNNSTTITVKRRTDSSSEYLEYIVIYIVPLVVQNYMDKINMLSLLIMMLIMGFVYVRANLFHINPVLNMLGYKMYKIEDDADNEFTLLSKNKILMNSKLKVNELGDTIRIEAKDEETPMKSI